MRKIDTISSFNGRLLIQEVFHELKYEKQRGTIACLLDCWKICTHEKNVNKYTSIEAQILHPIGLIKGTSVWLEEVVNRFYFAKINSFVYFGAAILLVLIGLRRFSDTLDDNIVIFGIIFEAFLLLFMFLVMLFTPNEEISIDKYSNMNDKDDLQNDLITEIGEISRDIAATSNNLDKIANNLEQLNINQINLVQKLNDISEHLSNAVSPNPEMISIMKNTNSELNEFKNSVYLLNESAKKINKIEIENAVKKELERIISEKLSK